MNQRIFFLAALALPGCGGSGGSGGGGVPVPVTVVIPSTLARDGDIRSEGTVNTAGAGLFVGDIDGIIPGASSRAVVGFDLTAAGIPAGATIQTATLSLEQNVGTGSPYTDLGNVLVDHVDLGLAVDATDYAANTLLAGFGTLSTDATLGVKTLDVGARVQADLTAGRTSSDFRLRFATDTDGDGNTDVAYFVDTENAFALGQPPLLKVVYLP